MFAVHINLSTFALVLYPQIFNYLDKLNDDISLSQEQILEAASISILDTSLGSTSKLIPYGNIAHLIQSKQVSIAVISIIRESRIKVISPLSWCRHVFGGTPFRFTFIIHHVESYHLDRKTTLDICVQEEMRNNIIHKEMWYNKH